MADYLVAPETRDLDTLAAKLEGWLADRIPASEGIRVSNLSYPSGAGQSHETILFDAHWREGGLARAQGFVVRIKPGRFTVYPDDLFEEQYRIIGLLHKTGAVPVAQPYWIERDPALLGSPFFIMAKVVGRVPVSQPPYAQFGWLADASPTQRRHLWENALRQLAAMQAVPLAELQFLRGPKNAPDGLAQEWDKYVRFVDWLGDLPEVPLLAASLARLKTLWPDNQPEGLVWGDARIGNMMFDEKFEAIAVMDWEQPSLGGALHDLSYFLRHAEKAHGREAPGGPLPGMGTREETIALWEELTGKSAADIEWYEQFSDLKMTCTGVRLGALRGARIMTDEFIIERLRLR